MEIWKQTSLFTYKENLTLDNITPLIKIFDQPTPYNLLLKGIEKYSRPGDLVLDPCCGNGMTGIVALENGRKAVLSDLNQLAVGITRSLFSFFDYTRVNLTWDEIKINLPSSENEDDLSQLSWERFVTSSLPAYPAFKRLTAGKIRKMGEMFHPMDLDDLRGIYQAIRRIKDTASRELMQVVFDCTLIEAAQIARSKDGLSFYMPRTLEKKYPLEIFQDKLELFLAYKSLIREQLAWDFNWTPKVHLASAYRMDYLETESVDYIILHLPEVKGFSGWKLSYLAEVLDGEFTDFPEEIITDLDYRGRYTFNRDLIRLLQELDRVLKEDGYLTLIFSGHYVLLSLLTRTAQHQGWQLVRGEVETMKGGQKEDYPVMSLTLQKKKPHTVVLGALNKMKAETLYETEEEILRKIEHYLTEHGLATTGELQKYLIENYLHDCLIEKPLEDILSENYLSTGKYWLKPSEEQKEDLFVKRTAVLEREFHLFIREMAYAFIREAEVALSYEELTERLLSVKLRTIFHSPYYRLLLEQCEKREIKLDSLVNEYLTTRRKGQFETLPQVIRRILKGDEAYIEIIPGELVGLHEWSEDVLFKIYFEQYEKSKRRDDQNLSENLARKVLEILPEVIYLDERKKEKIREYISRSDV